MRPVGLNHLNQSLRGVKILGGDHAAGHRWSGSVIYILTT